MVRFIPHKDLDSATLDEIIRIKSVAWPYTSAEQLEWIKKNIRPSDLHLLYYKDAVAVGYLNLVSLTITIDGNTTKGLGIGNVCTSVPGRGYGSKIMEETGKYLFEHQLIGLLFCKKLLINFYTKHSWKMMPNSVFLPEKLSEHVNAMIFNFDGSVNKIDTDTRLSF